MNMQNLTYALYALMLSANELRQKLFIPFFGEEVACRSYCTKGNFQPAALLGLCYREEEKLSTFSWRVLSNSWRTKENRSLIVVSLTCCCCCFAVLCMRCL